MAGSLDTIRMIHLPDENQQIRAFIQKHHLLPHKSHVSDPVGDHFDLHGLNLVGAARQRNLHVQPSKPYILLQLCIRVDAH